jgi:hypothetical protein
MNLSYPLAYADPRGFPAGNRRTRDQPGGGRHVQREGEARIETTMLALVRELSEELEDDRAVVEAVCNLLESGRVRLIGSFRGCRPDALASTTPGARLRIDGRLARRARRTIRTPRPTPGPDHGEE